MIEKKWNIYIIISLFTTLVGWYQSCIISNINNEEMLKKVYRFIFNKNQIYSLLYSYLILIIGLCSTFNMFK